MVPKIIWWNFTYVAITFHLLLGCLVGMLGMVAVVDGIPATQHRFLPSLYSPQQTEAVSSAANLEKLMTSIDYDRKVESYLTWVYPLISLLVNLPLLYLVTRYRTTHHLIL